MHVVVPDSRSDVVTQSLSHLCKMDHMMYIRFWRTASTSTTNVRPVPRSSPRRVLAENRLRALKVHEIDMDVNIDSHVDRDVNVDVDIDADIDVDINIDRDIDVDVDIDVDIRDHIVFLQ